MKLSIFLSLWLVAQVHATGFGQKVTLNLKNVPLQKVFTELNKQTGYSFLFTNEALKQSRKVTVNVKDQSLERVLEACLDDQALTYTIENKAIVIREKKPVVQLAPKLPETGSLPVVIDVKGVIVDPEGKPVIGASVVVKGDINNGTSTDGEGNFLLRGVDANATLMVSGVSIESQEVKLNGNGTLRIQVKTKVNQMEEVMVVAYGSQKKSSFTGSASVLKAEAIAGTPRSSALESLQGNVSGVMASNGTGQPGEMPDIRIRGIGSTRGGGPLYVVDGVPIEGGSPVALNPGDIESMTVLKDASAASLYGSRAANGVIIITTKKGFNGKTIFNFSSQFGVNKATLTDNVLPLNTTEMLELLQEGWVNSGRTAETFEAALAPNGVDRNINTDWFDALTRSGTHQQYNLSASGGNEKSTFFLSGSHYRAKAALLGSEFNRSTVAVRVSNQATDKLSFNVNLKLTHRYSNSQADAGSNGNPVRMYKRYQPWLKIYNADGTYDLSYANNYNPIAVVKENQNQANKFGMLGGLLTKYQILPSLSIENQANLDFDYRDNYDFKKSGIGTARSNGGEAEYTTDRTYNFVNTSILRFDKSFGDHEFGAFVGYESQIVREQGNSIAKENFLPNTFTLDNAASNASGGSSKDAHSLNSAFVNGSYNYDGRYYLTGSFRRDGSSRFGYKNRFGNFWSVGAAWNILKEDFMKSIDVLSELRLKTSYGVNGNQSLGDYEARALYGTGYEYNGAPGIVLSSYGNPELTWERNKPFNVGFDFGFMRNRLRGTIEYYTRTTVDQLASLGISATNGLTGYTANIGSIKNSGVELELTSVNVKRFAEGDFEWTTSFNISTLKNKVMSLQRTQTGDLRVSKVGDDYYRFNMIAYANVDRETGESLWYTDETKTTTTNDFSKAGRASFGSALPKFFGGLSNNVSWKGISLGVNLFYNFGNEIYDNWGANANSDGGKGFSATDKMPRYVYDNRWQKPGDITDVPKVMYLGTQSGSSSQGSSRFLYKGDYIRLRDVSLAYSLPGKWVRPLKLSNVSLNMRASNFFTWTKDSRLNFDPEVGVEGSADQNAPIYKTVLFGLDIKF